MQDNPSLSLQYLARQPGKRDAKPPLLLLLHGVGSNERDLFGLAPALDERFLILSLRAPMTLGYGAYGWYHVQFLPNGFRIDPEEVLESQQMIRNFIPEAVAAFEADAARVYMLGFSQGAIMSLNTLLTEPQAVAGVVTMSGRLLDDLKPTWADSAQLSNRPVLAVHGLYDNTIPVRDGRKIRDALSTLPLELTYREYPMGHEVSQASFADARNWLSVQLDRQ